MVKPKPKLYFKDGRWWCSGLGLTLCDVSPVKAYEVWLRCHTESLGWWGNVEV